jgi:hypothetical protein
VMTVVVMVVFLFAQRTYSLHGLGLLGRTPPQNRLAVLALPRGEGSAEFAASCPADR